MQKPTDSFWPNQRASSGSVLTLALWRAHWEPLCTNRMFPRVFSITSVKIRKPLIHFNRLTKPIELGVVIGVSSFVAVYVITTGYYFIRKILCCTIMVVIQCPHCSLEVELDDGVSGLFDCPHCGEEFQWGEIDEEIDHKKPTGSDWAMSRVPRYVGIVFVLGAVLLFFPVILALLLPCLLYTSELPTSYAV